jgi:hypothetical protein
MAPWQSSTPRSRASPEDFASFFGPLELVAPGAVDARQWHPDRKDAADLEKRDGYVLAAAARRLSIYHHKYPERVLASPNRSDLRRANGHGG